MPWLIGCASGAGVLFAQSWLRVEEPVARLGRPWLVALVTGWLSWCAAWVLPLSDNVLLALCVFAPLAAHQAVTDFQSGRMPHFVSGIAAVTSVPLSLYLARDVEMFGFALAFAAVVYALAWVGGFYGAVGGGDLTFLPTVLSIAVFGSALGVPVLLFTMSVVGVVMYWGGRSARMAPGLAFGGVVGALVPAPAVLLGGAG